MNKTIIYASNGSGIDDCFVTLNTDDPESDGAMTPECEGENCYVYEYSCDANSDSKQYEIIPCANGCLNGACQ